MGKKRRQPSLPKVHSLLDHYRKQTGRHIAAIEIDDPWNDVAHQTATLIARPGRGATDNPDAPREWLAPGRGRIKVMASTRDTVTGMYARRQIDEASFQAARKYQRLSEFAAWAASVKSVDVSAPQVQGSTRNYAAGIDQALAARDELRQIEKQLSRKLGEDGVTLLRDVLGRGITIENATKERGESDGPAVTWFGGFFRRCLRHLAEVTGFAVKNAYANQRHQDDRQEAERERQERNRRERKKGGRREEQAEPTA